MADILKMLATTANIYVIRTTANIEPRYCRYLERFLICIADT